MNLEAAISWEGLRREALAAQNASDLGVMVPMFADATGKAVTIKDITTKFAKACAGGYKPVMTAKAPAGWKDTVEKMKGKPGIDNPFALAHWMSDQGYTPHAGKGKSK